MNDQMDPDATPKPLQLIRNTDIADRTPYIPRRKASVGKRYGSSCQDVSTFMSLEPPQKPLRVWPKRHNSIKRSRMPKEERRLSRASVSEMNMPSDRYSANLAQSHQGLPFHDSSSISSSESRSHRRLFSRIMSSFSTSNNSAHAISTLAKSLGSGQGPMPRLSGSTARDLSSSTASTQSTETSLIQIDSSRTSSTNQPSSPNRLPAPPFTLIRQGAESQHLLIDQRHPSTSTVPDEIPSPALATATLHSISDITKAEMEKSATLWIAVDVECDIHYAEDPSSSLRSKALGPPHTDPGFLSKLSLELTPANGCSILRLIGSESRDFLLPGETWSIVAQVLADPPCRRKKQPVKAFSLQARPSSHALMDQLHIMLSPSSPSSQDLIHVTLTFEHVLLPSNIQCSISEALTLDRVSAWTLDPRRQYLRHRQSQSQSPRKPPQARHDHDQHHQHRDEIAHKLLTLLDPTLHNRQTPIGNREATEILQEFFFLDDVFAASSSRLQQRAQDLLHALEPRLRPASRAPPVSPARRPRCGIELERGDVAWGWGAGLRDVTNRWAGPGSGSGGTTGENARRTGRDERGYVSVKSGPGGAGFRGRGTEPERDVSVSVTTTPAPLFSPRKRASVANLHTTTTTTTPASRNGEAKTRIVRSPAARRGGNESGNGSPKKANGAVVSTPAKKSEKRVVASYADTVAALAHAGTGTGTGIGSNAGDHGDRGASIGSPRFYEDELDEARRIWRGMRESSLGSGRDNNLGGGGGGGNAEEGDGAGGEMLEEEEEADVGRRGVVGAPWL